MAESNPIQVDPVELYERCWRDGRPDPSQFIQQHPSLTADALSAILQIDLRQRWDSTDRKTASFYIETFPTVASSEESAIDLIYTEFLLRKRDNAAFDEAAFVDQYPLYRSTLLAQIAIHRLTESTWQRDQVEIDGPHKNYSNLPDHSTVPQVELNHQGVESAEAEPLIFADRFRAIRKLGRGGMGVVWEAEEISSGRRVAVKCLQTRLNRSRQAAEQFLNEGRLAASISHPHSAFLFEAICNDRERLLVMELMPGKTLADVAGLGEKLTLSGAVEYIVDMIEGLEAAHASGVIHRDLKPANCFLDAQGRVKIGDYGLARFLSDGFGPDSEFSGTPAFASPEQVRCEELTPQSDQYSLGATIFFLIAGRPPFSGNLQSIFRQVLNDPAPRLDRLIANVPEGFANIVDRCLAKTPEARFSSLSELYEAVLPYSKQPQALEVVGRRISAYAIDQLLIFLVSILFAVVMAAVWVASNPLSTVETTVFRNAISTWVLIAGVVECCLEFAYFALLEGFFGCTLGKRLMRLRVVTQNSENAGLKRCLLRSFAVPAGFGLSLLHVYSSSTQGLQGLISVSGNWSPVANTLLFIFVSLLFQAPLLICLSIMRARNEFRGLHEVLSGTRTVLLRKRQSVENSAQIQLASIKDADVPKFGPFQAIARLFHSDSLSTWDAFDKLVHRRVWIVQRTFSDDSLMPIGPFPDRPTRFRHLQSHQSADGSWIALETVSGKKFYSFCQSETSISWDQTRFLVLDLAHELTKSLCENTLPDPISFDHLWIHSGNRLKLMDQPFLGTESTFDGVKNVFAGERRAIQLLKAVLSSCIHEKNQPRQARGLDRIVHNAIDQKADQDLCVIEKVERHLKATISVPTSLSREERMGLVGIYLFIPCWLLIWIMMLSANVFSVLFVGSATQAFWGHAIFCSLLPIATTLLFGSPLLLRMLNVEILNKTGEVASRSRTFVRETISWAPLSIGGIAASWISVVGSSKPELSLFKELNSESFFLDPASLLFFLLTICACFVLGVVGLLCFILSDNKSLHDRLAGTSLFYKSDPL